MISKIAAIIILITPTVAFADQPQDPSATYMSDMKSVRSLVASAAEVSACGLRSRRWNALIQGTSVLEAYALAGRIWGTRNNSLVPAALAQFEVMGNSLQRIRLAMESPTAEVCKAIGKNRDMLPALDELAKLVGWSPK